MYAACNDERAAVPDYTVVLVTINSEAAAQSVAQVLVQEKLAACVNFFPVQSVYIWQGQLQQDPEWQLIIKTATQNFAALANRLTEIHPYDVPEILALPVQQGAQPYLNWLSAQLQN